MRAAPILSALAAAALTGCHDRPPPRRRAADAETVSATGTVTRTVYDRAVFRGLVLGKRPDEVTAAVGKPDRVVEAGTAVFWYYDARTINPTTGKPDHKVQVVFQYGGVTEINY